VVSVSPCDRGNEQANRGSGLLCVSQIIGDIGMDLVQCAIRCVATVAFLGDRQSDNTSVWNTKRIQQCLWLLGSHKHPSDAADYGKTIRLAANGNSI